MEKHVCIGILCVSRYMSNTTYETRKQRKQPFRLTEAVQVVMLVTRMCQKP